MRKPKVTTVELEQTDLSTLLACLPRPADLPVPTRAQRAGRPTGRGGRQGSLASLSAPRRTYNRG